MAFKKAMAAEKSSPAFATNISPATKIYSGFSLSIASKSFWFSFPYSTLWRSETKAIFVPWKAFGSFFDVIVYVFTINRFVSKWKITSATNTTINSAAKIYKFIYFPNSFFYFLSLALQNTTALTLS